MRKLLLILLIIFMLAVFFFLIIKYKNPNQAEFNPEIIKISASEVTIAWLSERSYKGKIYYKATADAESPISVTEDIDKIKQHKIQISELTPATRYSYWIGSSERKYQFQTKQEFSEPFSFLLVWGDISGKILSLMMTEMPEFIISLTSNPDKSSDWFKEIRPFIQIYDRYGLNSRFLKAVGEKTNKKNWTLDWGGLRLIFLQEESDIKDLLESSNADLIGIMSTGNAADLDSLKLNKLQQEILSYNKINPQKRVEFVLNSGNKGQVFQVQGTHFFEINSQKFETGSSGSMRFDIDDESAKAVFLNNDKEVILTESIIAKKLTCDECRKLADIGAYEKSIKAYLEFIIQNEGSFQIDDAYFAIASIYDEKLFQFEDALLWYRKLIDKYPDGNLNPLAEQRIEYISAYSDYNFVPLTGFEKIRKADYFRNENKKTDLLEKLENIITEFPKSKIAPEIQFWVANQYSQIDPGKAIEEYLALREQYPESQNSKEIFLNIGKTLYSAGNFKEALVNYEIALTELPELAKTINAQISRCHRNIRRIKISYLCWIIIVLIVFISLLKKPFGSDEKSVKKALKIFVFLFIISLFGAWLIKEQFSSSNEMLVFVFGYSFLVSFSSFISNSLIHKYFTGKQVLNFISGIVAGLILLLSSTYLLIYYLNIHYLIIFKL